MNRFCKIGSTLLFLIACCQFSYAQEQELEELSLEELMDIEIFSASKKKESAFDAPLSSSVITADEIRKSGVTSIPEAMRLAPGVIVREYINGSYDVHLRGLDNLAPNANLDNSQNLITLIMINGRIVFNYLNGGTFWNSLPIDLNDVDRIEIIRGPAAPMYGANAVAGVVNIITINPEEEGLMANANVSAGNHGTTIANINLGNRSNKVYVGMSGNFQKRERYQSEYYFYPVPVYSFQDGSVIGTQLGDYGSIPDSTYSYVQGPARNLPQRYPNPGESMNKYGINGFFGYDHSEDIKINVSLGYQDSESQIIFADNGYTPYSNNLINSFYTDVKAQIKGATIQVNNLSGEQSQTLGSVIPFNNFTANAEYDWQVGDLSIRPGLGYNSSKYEWDLLSEETVSFTSASLRLDYNKDNFRLIGALRGDSYSKPDDRYYSWQFAGMYKFNESNNFRVVYSRSNTAPFIGKSYLDVNQVIVEPMTLQPPAPPITIPGLGVQNIGNENLDLLTTDLLEFGFRSKITQNFFADLEVFFSTTNDFSDIFLRDSVLENNIQYAVFAYQILDLTAKQSGASLSLNFVPNETIQLKIFGTLQKTELENFSPNLFAPNVTEDMTYTGTPDYYGGFFLNYRPTDKLNINLNGYAMGAFEFDKSDGFVPPSPFTQPFAIELNDEVDATFTLNAKISYQALDQLNVFVNARNITNSQRQFGFTDSVEPLVLGGFSFQL